MGNADWIPIENASVEVAGGDTFGQLLGQPPAIDSSREPAAVPFPVVGIFRGFDLQDSPLIVLPSILPNEMLNARTAISLRRDQIGTEVVVVCEGGDAHRPIVMGVLQAQKRNEAPVDSVGTTVDADDERYVISAEREIVLRCGDSSITLTRAGKVIIKGNYVLSQSTGYNRIKGAAVDIN